MPLCQYPSVCVLQEYISCNDVNTCTCRSHDHSCYMLHVLHDQGFPKLIKFCSQFSKILPSEKQKCYRNSGKNGYLIDGLVAKVNDIVANG